MKKRFLVMAMASVALVSCVSEDVSDVKQKDEKVKIAFESPVLYNNVDSRAVVYGEIGTHTYGGINYSYPREENFIIYAVTHDSDFAGWSAATPADFNTKSISYDEDVDGWAPKSGGKFYYWENGKKMSFAACSPADLQQDNWSGQDKRIYDAEGLTITDFEVPANAAEHFDLLFSTRVCNQTSANMNHSASYYSGIPIQFQHALSSIRFSIANTSTENVVLTGISLKNVKYKGTFNENLDEDSSNLTRYDRTTGTGNVKPEWTVDEATITNAYIAFQGAIAFHESPRYVSALVEDYGTATDKCNQLLLMPQELGENVELEVHYTVNGSANSKLVKLKGLKSVNSAGTETGSIDEWEMGKRYTYRLTYSSDTADKDKIYFAPSTDEWIDVDVIIVPL